MRKFSAFDESKISDPNSGREIRISVSARKYFRAAFPDFSHERNARLNIIIAKEFAKSHNKILHYFPSKNKVKQENEDIDENMIQIRGSKNYFFLAITRGSYIDIIAVQTSWLKPRYVRKQKS